MDRIHTHYYLRRKTRALKVTEQTAYVVCCNDSVEAVVPHTCTEVQAEAIKEKMAREAFDRNPYEEDYGRYRGLYYWHVHGVPVVVP